MCWTGPPRSPVTGHLTVVEAQLLAGLAHQALGDQHAASKATERALALAEPDRLILPFAVAGSQDLLQTLLRHHTTHATLLTDILDIMSGSPVTPRQHPRR